MERYEANIRMKYCPICSCAMRALGDGQVLKCFHCGSVFRMVDFSMDDRHMTFERVGICMENTAVGKTYQDTMGSIRRIVTEKSGAFTGKAER